jgi:hypothetical protein
MSLCPGLLWLTLNLALIIQCLSRNNICLQIYITRKMFPSIPGVLIPPPPPTVQDHLLTKVTKDYSAGAHSCQNCLLQDNKAS